jgi:hypothetical protein
MSGKADIILALEKFKTNPPIPANYSNPGPHYLLSNVFDFLSSQLSAQPNADQLAASTLFFVPPIFDSTMGNILTHYVEARLCALTTGLHFVTVFNSLINSTDGSESGDDLYSYFDSVVFNPLAEFPSSANIVKTACSCINRCHGE